jgi:SAM-dependent methyltransferase
MTEIVTGAAYVKAITSVKSDRRARCAFHALVEGIARPGAALFDFGSGPGLDARFYAEHGFSVAAYDVDPAMREYFAGHCADFVAAGRIVMGGGSYRDFLARRNIDAGADFRGRDGFDLVTSNFAPLNLIDDLHELFAKFHALTAPNGRVLASVLNPYCVRDMKYAWWWRNAPRLWRDGRYSVPGEQAPIVRRGLGNYAAQSAPYFTLERVFPGRPVNRNRIADGIEVGGGGRHAWLHLIGCRFMFLLFRRQGELP